jgi:hypothetical protein
LAHLFNYGWYFYYCHWSWNNYCLAIGGNMLITVDDINKVVKNNPKSYTWHVYDRATGETRNVTCHRSYHNLVLCDDGGNILTSKYMEKMLRHKYLDMVVKVGLFNYQYKHYNIFYHEKHIRDIITGHGKVILVIDSDEWRNRNG